MRFRTIAVSLRHYWPEKWDAGCGGFTFDQHVADLGGFIAALGAGPTHVIGHPRGGHIAVRLAERHQRLVRYLVFAEQSGILDASLLPPSATSASTEARPVADHVSATVPVRPCPRPQGAKF